MPSSYLKKVEHSLGVVPSFFEHCSYKIKFIRTNLEQTSNKLGQKVLDVFKPVQKCSKSFIINQKCLKVFKSIQNLWVLYFGLHSLYQHHIKAW